MVKHKYFNEEKYYLSQGYWKRTICPSILLSHDVWNYHYPEDVIQKGEIIHHKNGDSTDDRIENLQKMTDFDHRSLHNKSVDHSNENNPRWKGGLKHKQLYLGGETIETNCSYSILQNVNSFGEILHSRFIFKCET